MADPVLFDTDVLIDVGRGVNAALDALEQAEREHTPAISTITRMELIVGCQNQS